MLMRIAASLMFVFGATSVSLGQSPPVNYLDSCMPSLVDKAAELSAVVLSETAKLDIQQRYDVLSVDQKRRVCADDATAATEKVLENYLNVKRWLVDLTASDTPVTVDRAGDFSFAYVLLGHDRFHGVVFPTDVSVSEVSFRNDAEQPVPIWGAAAVQMNMVEFDMTLRDLAATMNPLHPVWIRSGGYEPIYVLYANDSLVVPVPVVTDEQPQPIGWFSGIHDGAAIELTSANLVPEARVSRFRSINGSATGVPNYGVIDIQSEPIGAEVYIDGTRHQDLTNVTILYPVGAVEIRLSKSGFEDYEESTTLSESQTHFIDVQLATIQQRVRETGPRR